MRAHAINTGPGGGRLMLADGGDDGEEGVVDSGGTGKSEIRQLPWIPG